MAILPLFSLSCGVAVVPPPITPPPASPTKAEAPTVIAQPNRHYPTQQPPTPVVSESQPVSASPAPQHHPLKYQELTLQGITVSLLTFDTRQHQLVVADQKPGAQWSSARQASISQGGIAAINGGFFTPEGTPLGLVKSQGKSSGSWNTSSSLTSGVYQLHNGRPRLLRNRSANRGATELLQTGPFLLENAKPVSGLSTKRIAQRSILLWDGGTHFGLAHTSNTTLAELASALKELPSHLPKKTVLNLDGGRSCDFSLCPSIASVQKGHWLKSPVRNYLVLKPSS